MAFKIVTSLAILLLAVGHSRPLEDRQSEGSAEDRSSESLVKDEQEDESQESRASPRGEEEEDSRKGKQPEPVKDTTKESYEALLEAYYKLVEATLAVGHKPAKKD
ncbi:uncharacterized protein LOC105698616 [Orussus abietinus]|uniref:uncharacterized protein LOC105698616 n=1 Tax=Orussus abietinus TaxID=222816 RepID=UPI0006261DB9|nr:uncharacterized protein LOC105698616 [Orussus abietinus]